MLESRGGMWPLLTNPELWVFRDTEKMCKCPIYYFISAKYIDFAQHIKYRNAYNFLNKRDQYLAKLYFAIFRTSSKLTIKYCLLSLRMECIVLLI